MQSPLKLASAWRIVKDVDLDGIRRRSHERFELWIIANDGAATREVASLLAPGPEHHPWLLRMTPEQLPAPVTSIRRSRMPAMPCAPKPYWSSSFASAIPVRWPPHRALVRTRASP
jgi:hypothetical protein